MSAGIQPATGYREISNAIGIVPVNPPFRVWIVAHGGLVAIALAYVLWTLIDAGAVYGVSGQPRSAAIPVGWVVPWPFAVYLLITISVCFLAPRQPLLGVAAYIGLMYTFPVHTPEWIFVQATWLRLIAALLAASAAMLFAYQHGHALWPFHDLISWLLFAFVTWNILCALVAALFVGGYQPALQFHPSRLLESLLIFSVLVRCKDADRPLFVITGIMVIALIIQIAFTYGIRFRDAGIASDIVIALPLLYFLFVKAPRWWLRCGVAAIGIGGVWILFLLENRGSAIAFLISLLAALLMSRHYIRWLAIGLPMAAIAVVGFLSTRFGDRFRSIGSLAEILESNERVLVWRAGFEMGIDHPLFGIGPGNFVNWAGEYNPNLEHHSGHNLWVDIFAESGFFGLLLYTTMLLVVLTSCIHNTRRLHSDASRWSLVSLVAFLGVGVMLTTTMFVLPYMLFAISAIDRDRFASVLRSTS